MTKSPPERYTRVRKIGEGGFGGVYLAKDTVLGRQVAIKSPETTHDLHAKVRYLNEGRLLARLNHPNITQIYDVIPDEERDCFHIVMEYVEGEDLATVLSRGPISLDLVLEVARGILEALSAAHAQDIVHRDIKPPNVIVGDTVKLTDFGLADLREFLRQGTQFVAGTPAYISPEQIEGRPTDPRADLYSLGVVLYEMIANGQRPFDCSNEAEMLDAHLHTSPTPLTQYAPAVPPALEAVVMRLLEKDPRDRYPSAKAVIEALNAIYVGPRERNLPVWLTPFVGRDKEVAEICAYLQDPNCRLLTLVGLGGMGKTRLAAEAARAHQDASVHGVTFVSLAPLQSVNAVVPAVAQAVGLSLYEGADPRQRLLDYLRQERMLLVMDNFEHLLDGVDLVTDILRVAPEIKILATSRERLNVEGEHLFPVAGMVLPEGVGLPADEPAATSAVGLFVQSARQVRPSFEPSDEDLGHIVQICRLVDGMPLGIVLAASLLEALSPAEVVAEISQGIDILETDLRDVPARQRSLRAVLDHSWSLLTEREQRTLQALSVFCGGFTRHAARAIASASLRDLMALTHKSLLQRTHKGRYVPAHDLLRQYAAEKLACDRDTGAAVHDQHCAYYLGAIQDWDAELKGPEQQAALAKMDVEIENARAAWNWALERGQVERLTQAVDGLCRFYKWRGRLHEGRVLCQSMVEQLGADVSIETLPVVSEALAWQGRFCLRLGHRELAERTLRQALALLENPVLAEHDVRRARAFILMELGHTTVRSDRQKARWLYKDSLAAYRALGDLWGTARAMVHLASVAERLGDYEQARQLYTESLSIRRKLGDQRGIANSLQGLGENARHQGEMEEAERLARESLTILRTIGARSRTAYGLCTLGNVLGLLGNLDKAHTLLAESASIFARLGERALLLRTNLLLGFVEVHQGNYEQAHVRAHQNLASSREMDSRRRVGDYDYLLSLVALARREHAQARDLLGKSISIYRKVGQREQLGNALAVLALATRGVDQVSQAEQHLVEALQTVRGTRSFLPTIYAVAATALLLSDQQWTEQAVELYALALRYPVVASSQWYEDVAGDRIAAAASSLPSDVVALAEERGRARDLWTTAESLLAEPGKWRKSSN